MFAIACRHLLKISFNTTQPPVMYQMSEAVFDVIDLDCDKKDFIFNTELGQWSCCHWYFYYLIY